MDVVVDATSELAGAIKALREVDPARLADAETVQALHRQLECLSAVTVDSPELADARHELHRLGVALGRCDLGTVAAADAKMLAIVKTLDPDEGDRITPVAHEVHLRAVASLKSNACA